MGVGPNVTAVLYQAGLTGGATPAACFESGGWTNQTKAYVAVAWKIPSNFVFVVDGINKLIYMKTTQGANSVFVALQTAPNTYQPQYRTQSPGPTTLNFPPNVAGQTGFLCNTGQWYIWEVFAQLNTALTAPYNGVLQIWMTTNGTTVMTHNYNNVGITSLAGDHWTEMDFQPYYGGGGSNVPSNQNCYLGPVAFFGG